MSPAAFSLRLFIATTSIYTRLISPGADIHVLTEMPAALVNDTRMKPDNDAVLSCLLTY